MQRHGHDAVRIGEHIGACLGQHCAEPDRQRATAFVFERVDDMTEGTVVAACRSRSINCAEFTAIADGWNQRLHVGPAGVAHRTAGWIFERR